MAIPTKFDGDAAAIDDAASSILLQVKIMQKAAHEDLPRMRLRLRKALGEYTVLVMATARK
jgi:hypothetical protein